MKSVPREIAQLRARVARIMATEENTVKYLDEAIVALGHALTAERVAHARMDVNWQETFLR